MKRLCVVFLSVLFLCGCRANSDLERVMTLRQCILNADSCAFRADITADYGDVTYTFSLNCQFDAAGDMTFEVLSPESIKGITGTVNSEKGALTFDDQVLLFPLIADEQLTPVIAPWLVMKALRSGYIQACGSNEGLVTAVIDDSYAASALQADFWFTEDMIPTSAEIMWQNRRILTVHIHSFSYM